MLASLVSEAVEQRRIGRTAAHGGKVERRHKEARKRCGRRFEGMQNEFHRSGKCGRNGADGEDGKGNEVVTTSHIEPFLGGGNYLAALAGAVVSSVCATGAVSSGGTGIPIPLRIAPAAVPRTEL